MNLFQPDKFKLFNPNEFIPEKYYIAVDPGYNNQGNLFVDKRGNGFTSIVVVGFGTDDNDKVRIGIFEVIKGGFRPSGLYQPLHYLVEKYIRIAPVAQIGIEDNGHNCLLHTKIMHGDLGAPVIPISNSTNRLNRILALEPLFVGGVIQLPNDWQVSFPMGVRDELFNYQIAGSCVCGNDFLDALAMAIELIKMNQN